MGRRRRGLPLLAALPALLALPTLGCASAIRPLGPVAAIRLGEDEGLLVLHVDTDVPLAAIDSTCGTAAENLPRGHHVWLVRAAAGSYRWKEIRVSPEAGRFHRERLRGEEATRFQVVAGHVNYPGALVVRGAPVGGAAMGQIRVRSVERGAMALRRLRGDHAALLARYPLRDAGDTPDAFLEHYTRVREAAR